MTNEIYFSTDVETDGPIPGPNSMLSLGSAAFLSDGTLIDTFSLNLAPLDGASPDPATMEWWNSNLDAFQAATHSQRDPESAMTQFSEWVTGTARTYSERVQQKVKPVFVGFPAGFDFLFVYWYLIRFTGKSPFSFSALDGKSYAMALLKKGYRDSTKRNYPRRWLPERKHTHVAVQDAIEQGEIFCRMLKENLEAK